MHVIGHTSEQASFQDRHSTPTANDTYRIPPALLLLCVSQHLRHSPSPSPTILPCAQACAANTMADTPRSDADQTRDTAEAPAPATSSQSPSGSLKRRRSASPSSPSRSPSLSEDGETTSNPPLPDEDAPPLPDEAPPGDDGWDALWDSNAQAYYFYNRLTRVSQWENPRVPEPAAATANYGSYDRFACNLNRLFAFLP